jgi:hypothetical protein
MGYLYFEVEVLARAKDRLEHPRHFPHSVLAGGRGAVDILFHGWSRRDPNQILLVEATDVLEIATGIRPRWSPR